jgi:hypothetical protein
VCGTTLRASRRLAPTIGLGHIWRNRLISELSGAKLYREYPVADKLGVSDTIRLISWTDRVASALRRLTTCLVGFLLVVTSTYISRAEELPLWEAGLGFTGLSLPDYRGSDQQRFYVLPFPYLVYRGDFLRLDSNGLSGWLFHSDRVHLNLSADAAVPV